MLDYSILKAEGILQLVPHAPLNEKDFTGLTVAVDSYLSAHPKLHGVLIYSQEFPGWENFGAFSAHMRFARQHHEQIERIALVTDSNFAAVAEALGKHFTAAKFKHFAFVDDKAAVEWLQSEPE